MTGSPGKRGGEKSLEIKTSTIRQYGELTDRVISAVSKMVGPCNRMVIVLSTLRQLDKF